MGAVVYHDDMAAQAREDLSGAADVHRPVNVLELHHLERKRIPSRDIDACHGEPVTVHVEERREVVEYNGAERALRDDDGLSRGDTD
jgi:hypothetical protein